MLPTNDPRYMLYGLAVGSISKSLLSLGPNVSSWEDWALFAGTFLGTFGTTLSSNPNYMLYGMVLASVGKAVPSLVQNHRSLEDWLLFVLPVVAGVFSLVSANPSYGLTGLFFGAIGKSLGSISPAPTPTPNTTTTQPPPQPSGLSGNRNYILWNNCSPMINPSVTLRAKSDIHASSNWDLQVNAYAPSGTDAYMQFVLAVTTTGQVQWSIENWPVSGDNLFNTGDHQLFQLPSSFLPQGYSIGLSMRTDPTNSNMTSVLFSVDDENGARVAQQSVPLDSTLPLSSGHWSDSYLSQVVGFEPNIVGYNNGVVVRFSSGCVGSLECSADSITVSTSIPSCAEAKAGTVEDSNMNYAIAIQSAPTTVTIDTFVP
jgi:hypothetical protein